ncbi:DUF3422 family protein [Porticoccus sp. GXU_MW_L64]
MTTPINEHQLRHVLSEELHARNYPVLTGPFRAYHMLMLVTEAEREQEYRHVAELCRLHRQTPPGRDEKHFSLQLEDAVLRWERHTEFSTYTLYVSGPFGDPFLDIPPSQLPSDWAGKLPGLLLRSMKLAVLEKGEALDEQSLQAYFDLDHCACSELLDGAARVWTNFRIHEDGCGHLLVEDCSLDRSSTGLLAQQLLEMGNYRKLALLGLPLAQSTAPKLNRLDEGLTEIMAALKRGDKDEEQLLDRLSDMSFEMEHISSQINYRLGATDAYYHLAMDRLQQLREQRHGNRMTLEDITGRRVTPAFRTCEAVRLRHQDLSARLTRVYDLLRTRINVNMERQSRDLLESMDKRVSLQLKLQQVVEGLSVVVISYYFLSLLFDEMDALHSAGLIGNPTGIRAASIPLVMLLVWWVRRRMQKKAGVG